MRTERINLKELLLDPNNYRLQDESGYTTTSEDRFHLEQVQRATLQRLKTGGLKELRDSIVTNGFLPIEQIVVMPYTHDKSKSYYLVIEGNRRVAALRQIAQEIDGGVEIPKEVVETLDSVPCVVVDDSGQSDYFRETLMGIRHVGGIKEWGGYQRAKLIADMRDKHNLEGGVVASKLGLSTREVNRRYRAFKALQQMREDDEYGDLGEPSLYPLFHEAIAVTEVRDWLGWDDTTAAFKKPDELRHFYQMITPSVSDEGGPQKPPKLSTYSDIRQLKNILPNADARRFLLDTDRTFLDAMTVANREDLSRKWRNELSEATASLKGIGALEVRNFSDDDVALLDALAITVREIKEIYEAVRQR
ncbi:hypothetical protein SAE02_71760 [Skermanella aerolata]|uniref:ParB/Sulfiredoxin domain-containing protein n=1 Tax=Skermanella aerolata TaxID=393310 RepID=A0A512E2S2_9PROT|nr:ParB N-terminal domain-containing protein [Skermanella aerolata]GEO43028.1 hypothetical protein SAE02_71760 [Skermanella aerolata]